MRIIGALSVALALSAGVAFAAAAKWATYTSDAFGFGGLFPVTPDVKTDNNKVQLNGRTYTVTMHTISAKGANGSICLVVHAIYAWPIDIEPELIADRDNFTKGISGAVTTSKRTTSSRGKGATLPALLFDATSATYVWQSLIVIDGQIVYEVAGGVPKAGGQRTDLARCVDGFELRVRK